MNTDTTEKSFHESSIYTGGIHDGLFNSLYQTAKFKRQNASIFFHLEIYKLDYFYLFFKNYNFDVFS